MLALTVLVCFLSVEYVKASAITAAISRITVYEDQNARLEWTVPSTNTNGDSLSSFIVRLKSKGRLTIVSGDATNVAVSQNGKNEFGERLTATKVGDKLTLFITKTEKRDQHTFLAIGLYDLTPESAEIELMIKSKVIGTKDICQSNMEREYYKFSLITVCVAIVVVVVIALILKNKRIITITFNYKKENLPFKSHQKISDNKGNSFQPSDQANKKSSTNTNNEDSQNMTSSHYAQLSPIQTEEEYQEITLHYEVMLNEDITWKGRIVDFTWKGRIVDFL